MKVDLPYVAEYAKSGTASCKTCKNIIDKDSLRFGVMVQSPYFDGKIPLWHHFTCFLEANTIENVADIANFENLRCEDQKRIKENKAEVPAEASGKSKRKEYGFSVEYAKVGRANCRGCGKKILKGEIRISEMVYDTLEAKRCYRRPGWHHVDCFVSVRLDLEFPDSADKLAGFKTLKEEDQKMLKEKIDSLGVKRKAEEVEPPEAKRMKKEEVILKSQNALLSQMRDQIKANLKKTELVELLEYNNQHVSPAERNNLDILADCLVFGAIDTCPECKNSAPRYKIDSYRCSGDLTEWTKCQFVTRTPARKPFKVPEEYKDKYDFLQEYKYVKRDRYLAEKEDTVSSTVKKGPLNGYIICVLGNPFSHSFQSPISTIEKIVIELGGSISQEVNKSVHCCISTEDEVVNRGLEVLMASIYNIHVVSPKFLDDIKNGSTPTISMKENAICFWGGDPVLKFGIKQENKLKEIQEDSSSSYNLHKSEPKKVKIHEVSAVDPNSGMKNKCHVYQKKDNFYNCVLGMVDVSRGINTYYKLQLLESDKKAKYYLFRSWGRVGTPLGNNKLEEMKNVSDGIANFEKFYLEKTGNHWIDRKNFVKKPGLFYPIDIDYGEELKELKPSANCKLPQAVQELIRLIFNIEAMKKAMVEFEIDLKEMPLGKLSRKQIESAYPVLSEAQDILMTGSNANKILDVSNRFYTLMPHDFGLRTPPLLDNEELIKSKIEMLDSLLEIEYAYNMMKSRNEISTNDPVDECYRKLQTDIEILDDKCKEFEIIKKYMENTQNYRKHNLKKVFKINRHGERERYAKYKDLHNKKLLWHGSRLTNYVGILSQGLRIAPPEAPSSGYMFGKGIYFADMMSKSAGYCHSFANYSLTDRKDTTGLLLLCEVALGNMYEKTCAEFVEKLPKNKHSTKGLGMTVPNPKQNTFIDDVEVPYGKPVASNIDNCYLCYNEYIVYDVNQVNIKYLVQVSF